MNLRRLRYFVALAERLNFTETARFLGIAQPPLSVQIRNLETEVGTALFHRERRKIRLTPMGMLFFGRGACPFRSGRSRGGTNPGCGPRPVGRNSARLHAKCTFGKDHSPHPEISSQESRSPTGDHSTFLRKSCFLYPGLRRPHYRSSRAVARGHGPGESNFSSRAPAKASIGGTPGRLAFGSDR